MQHDSEPGPGPSASDDLPGDRNSPEQAATGEPRVDRALAELGDLGDLPVAEHPQVYERIHGALSEVLGELRPASGTGG